MKIKSKISTVFLTTAIILMTSGAGVFYYFSVKQIKTEVFHQLETVAVLRASYVETFLQEMKGRMVDFASDGYIKNCLSALGGNEAIECTAADLTDHLIKNKLSAIEGLSEVFTVNSEGKVVASTIREPIGLDVREDPSFIYGKERPLDPGHDEEAWAKNRRAHFVILK